MIRSLVRIQLEQYVSLHPCGSCSWGSPAPSAAKFPAQSSSCSRVQPTSHIYYFLSVFSLSGLEVCDQVVQLFLSLCNDILHFLVFYPALFDCLFYVSIELSVSFQFPIQPIFFTLLLFAYCLWVMAFVRRRAKLLSRLSYSQAGIVALASISVRKFYRSSIFLPLMDMRRPWFCLSYWFITCKWIIPSYFLYPHL